MLDPAMLRKLANWLHASCQIILTHLVRKEDSMSKVSPWPGHQGGYGRYGHRGTDIPTPFHIPQVARPVFHNVARDMPKCSRVVSYMTKSNNQDCHLTITLASTTLRMYAWISQHNKGCITEASKRAEDIKTAY